MAFTRYTDLSSSAPVLSGQNGALVAILDYFLVLEGWSIDYSSGNVRFYKRPTLNGLLYVNDDSSASGSAGFALVRACRSRSGATPVDPYPLSSQVADNVCNWRKSSAANSTARAYELRISPEMIRFAPYMSGDLRQQLFIWGRPAGLTSFEVDPDNSDFITVANSSNASQFFGLPSSSYVGVGNTAQSVFFNGDISGTIKSTRAVFYSSATAAIGSVSGAPAAGAGYGNAIEREYVGITCSGSQSVTPGSTARLKRGWIPNLWSPLHANSAAYPPDQTFEDTAYNPAAIFRISNLIASPNATAWVIEEDSNTWSPP